MGGVRAMALALLLASAAAGDAAPAPDLARAYPKDTRGTWTVRVVLDDLLERDLWSTNDWKPCRTRKASWVFRVDWKVKSASAKGVRLDVALGRLEGDWSDRGEDGSVTWEAQAALPLKEAKPNAWETALQALEGAPFQVELGPAGGVTKVAGLEAKARKAFQILAGGKATRAPATDLAALFSETGWRALLDALVPAAAKARAYPLPWSQDFSAQPLQPFPASWDPVPEGVGLSVAFAGGDGKVDETLQFIGQPGFHSLGTERRGSGKARFGEDGRLAGAEAGFEVRDRWDLYRLGSKADRFERKAKATLSLTVE